MAYTPINWQTGDTITAEKMNKMDNGWGVESTQLFSESVTTAASQGQPAPRAMLVYSTQITAPSVTVNFGGTDYEVNAMINENTYIYGGMGGSGPDFSTYPFCIISTPSANMIYTETAGTYTVAVSTSGIAVSDNFSNAVNQCVDTSAIPMRCEDGVTTLTEVTTALLSGQLIYFSDGSGNYFVNTVDDRSHEVYFYPPNESFTVGFNEDELFTISWN